MKTPIEYTVKGLDSMDLLTMWLNRKAQCASSGHPGIVDEEGKKLHTAVLFAFRNYLKT